ncbi:MAG: helix-turn-helix transcriptional regulator [Bacilli bacterium]|nr:helix-turn-helix transcriptional regulator [Bacilli bacterium]
MKIIANDYENKFVMKMLRETIGLTQDEFGESICLKGSTIQGYEIGKRKFTFETLMKIAKTHGYIVTIEKKK